MPELETLVTLNPEQVEQAGSPEIVLGIPTYNNSETIELVMQAAEIGLREYFPTIRSVVIQADGGSSDGTPEKAQEAAGENINLLQVCYPLYAVNRMSEPYYGIPGKGSAYRSIFLLAQKFDAKVCAVLDADATTITADWIGRLVNPALRDTFDFVAPHYVRHKYEGTLNNSIVYPLTRALYGKRIRQPIGGDFAFSANLIDHYLSQDIWNSEIVRVGLDIWLTTEAVAGRFRSCQAALGPKMYASRDPVDLTAMLAQVLGSVFSEMERNSALWQKTRGSEPAQIFGPTLMVTTDPVAVNWRRMIESFRLGYRDLLDIWGAILPPATLLDLKKLSRRTDEECRFEYELWARILYDFALGYRLKIISRDHLLKAFTPLYLGWTGALIHSLHDAGPEEFEQQLEKLCLAFEGQKPYLISRWRWPDRFNP